MRNAIPRIYLAANVDFETSSTSHSCLPSAAGRPTQHINDDQRQYEQRNRERGTSWIVADFAKAAVDQIGNEQDATLAQHHRNDECADGERETEHESRQHAARGKRKRDRGMRFPDGCAERLRRLDQSWIECLQRRQQYDRRHRDETVQQSENDRNLGVASAVERKAEQFRETAAEA